MNKINNTREYNHIKKMRDGIFYYVTFPFGIIGIIVYNGRIIEAPPLMKRWTGQIWVKFYDYYKKRFGSKFNIELIK